MAWNENGNGKDPWRRDGEQPNDLDKIVQDWQRRLGAILGGGGGGRKGGGTGGWFVIVLLLAAWLLSGFYRVDEAERGVVQRFGAYTKTTMPGLRWHLPFPIERVDIVNIEEVNDFNYSTEMLTADDWMLRPSKITLRILPPILPDDPAVADHRTLAAEARRRVLEAIDEPDLLDADEPAAAAEPAGLPSN